jgi:hypothetical protein
MFGTGSAADDPNGTSFPVRVFEADEVTTHSYRPEVVDG